MVFFNIIGAVMLAAAYAAAKGAEDWLGDPSEATFMLVMGSVAMTSDVTYRTLTSAGHWFAPSGGGSLMFLPVWAFGLCWLGFASAYHVLGFEKSTMLNVVVIGSVIAIMLVVAIVKTPPPPPNEPG